MKVLGIETSCDDTSAAVVDGPDRILTSVVSSQDDEHGKYGGVVPEIASRKHVEALPVIVDEAVAGSGLAWDDLQAVAVTRGPGLSSSLLPGLVAAQALAFRLGMPLWTLNHLEAHIFSAFIGLNILNRSDIFPLLALTVSGGHTNLVLVHGLHHYEMVGVTIDDAAGEALDKAAKLLGLGYPGGPAIEETARSGDPEYVDFPRGIQSGDSPRIPKNVSPEMCFSFSGVKTSLLYYIRSHPEVYENAEILSNVAASYQSAIIDALIQRVECALHNYEVKGLACAGGVARNSLLREKMEQCARNFGIPAFIAQPDYCTDNAAMVAALGAAMRQAGIELPAKSRIAPRFPLA